MPDEISAAAYRAKYGQPAPKKQSKYRNHKVEVDGFTFDSKAEAIRWWDLRQMERAGEITDLERQVRLPLIVNGVKVGTYIPDFRYRSGDGQIVIEDVKSEPTKTPVYRLKKRMVAAIYGIEIREVQ